MAKEHPLKNPFMNGKMIEPLKLEGNDSVKDFINNVFGDSGYNARNLSDACLVFKKMIEENATICLTLAGAMTPIGMSGPVIKMIELGFFDFIISTGANLYHDMHRTFNCPMRQGKVNVDDEELNKHGVARIYDVFIEDSETMFPTDRTIIEAVLHRKFDKPMSTADLHYLLGKAIENVAPHPEKSVLAAAAKHNVPIYTSSPGDSSVAMNLIVPHYYSHQIPIDPLKDVVETSAIVYGSEKNGVVIVGGGSPKNFYMQTQPTLWQILDINKGGHDYFIQLTTDAPHWGGLSGATPQEAKSWGKVKDALRNNVVVYSCASITFPLLCQFARMSCSPRKQKELLLKKNDYSKKLLEEARTREKMQMDCKELGLPLNDKFIKYFE
jgi:deoxyhypusine synthase